MKILSKLGLILLCGVMLAACSNSNAKVDSSSQNKRVTRTSKPKHQKKSSNKKASISSTSSQSSQVNSSSSSSSENNQTNALTQQQAEQIGLSYALSKTDPLPNFSERVKRSQDIGDTWMVIVQDTPTHIIEVDVHKATHQASSPSLDAQSTTNDSSNQTSSDTQDNQQDQSQSQSDDQYWASMARKPDANYTLGDGTHIHNDNSGTSYDDNGDVIGKGGATGAQ